MGQKAQENLESFRMAREDKRNPTPAEIEAQRDREQIRARPRAEAESRSKLRKAAGATASSGSSGPSVKTLPQIWDALEPLYLKQTMSNSDMYYYHMLAHGGTRPWNNYNALTQAETHEALAGLRHVYAKYIRR